MSSWNGGFGIVPFVAEQADALKAQGVEIDFFGVIGHGLGYFKNIKLLNKKIREYHPDIIHAHYGLSGLLANLQRRIPVVTTFHGSDIHLGGLVLRLSKIAYRLSAYNIFVAEDIFKQAKASEVRATILPCGINLDGIVSMPREEARRQMGLSLDEKIVLFSSSFTNEVKNYPLAKAAMEKVKGVKLVEMKGFNRHQVCLMMNAANCLLMTSHREGSPQVVKEAMACGTPVVSVDVGDVGHVILGTKGCYIAKREPDDIADKIKMALNYVGKTDGHQRILDLGLSNELVAKQLIGIYKLILER